MNTEIKKLETELYELTKKITALRADNQMGEVANYSFQTAEGPLTLKEMFAGKDKLLVIHNMGQGCRYCTLWADGFNGFLPHLESAMAVVLVSKDDPETQRRFANSRGWRFRMASHAGTKYAEEQTSVDGEKNAPGVSLYELKDGKITLKNRSGFGPYDQFCSLWNLIGLAGLNAETWTPQFHYWKRPEKMDDGGNNLL